MKYEAIIIAIYTLLDTEIVSYLEIGEVRRIETRVEAYKSGGWDKKVYDLGEKTIVPKELAQFLVKHPMNFSNYEIPEESCQTFVKKILNKFAPELVSKMPEDTCLGKLGMVVAPLVKKNIKYAS